MTTEGALKAPPRARRGALSNTQVAIFRALFTAIAVLGLLGWWQTGRDGQLLRCWISTGVLVLAGGSAIHFWFRF
jgi:hypothetical protein